MNKLSKEKRNQLILASLGTLAAVAGLWFTLIRFQQSGLQDLTTKKTASEAKLAQIQESIKNSALIDKDLGAVSNQLAAAEEEMASGDLYLSMVNAIRKFKLPYNVDIPQFKLAGGATAMNLLPRFPYKQVTVSVAGTAFYYDLGKFISDFENQFPASRILNLELSPASAQGPDEKEKLSFRMDVVSLVKPGGAHSANTP